MNNDYYDTYGNDAYATQDDPYADNSMAYQPANTGAIDGALPNGMSNAQMTGLLIASGLPFGKAMLATSQMQQQQNARALQSYRFQMAQQKFLDKQNQAQSGDDAFNQLLNGSPASAAVNPAITATNSATNPNLPAANTLADMNASGDESDITDPNSPNNLYTQMDDPNAVPSGVIPNTATGNSGIMPVPTGAAPFPGTGLTQEIKDQARLMWKTGDKKGAIKLIQAAKTQGAGNGFVKNPMMGPSRGGQGGTYTNPQTGQTISSDTSANTTKDQATVAALQRVQPQVERLIQVMPQFQRFTTQATAAAQGLGNKYFGGNYNLPSQLQEGKAIVEAAPESLLKAYGLNVTDESLKSMRALIQPGDGESPKGYADRLSKSLAEMSMFGDQAKLRLANGINVTLPKNSANQSNMSSGNNAMPMGQQTAQPKLSSGSPYNQQLLQQQAQAAIARGADPKAVQARIMQLIGGGQ